MSVTVLVSNKNNITQLLLRIVRGLQMEAVIKS